MTEKHRGASRRVPFRSRGTAVADQGGTVITQGETDGGSSNHLFDRTLGRALFARSHHLGRRRMFLVSQTQIIIW